MKTVATLICLLFIAATSICNSQPRAGARAEFEVASIKPHEGPLRSIFTFSSSGPHIKLEGYQVSMLIWEAYNVKPHQVTFASSVTRDETYFDLLAKAEGEGNPTRAEVRTMLQALLADRFKLKFHYEMRSMPVYVMTVAKGGPKFKESPIDAPRVATHRVNGRNMVLNSSQATMSQLADALTNSYFLDRPVLDKTGLTGAYNINMEATPDRTSQNPRDGDLSVFTAMQEQLGLKLDPQKGEVKVLVVDSFEKPSEN